MLLCDVNVLVYAFREDAVDHERYLAWLDGLVNGPARFGASDQVLSAVVRLVTHPRVNKTPSRLSDALDFVNAIRDAPGCVLVAPGPGHWKIFEGLCGRLKLTGNLVSDAWHAALAIEGGHEWVTTDRDFARFPGLRTRHPLDR